ncbi:C-type lectin domain family 4 member E-like [Salminus brasiliensis]|uniref:C-type lectin domain family 4 member E-like n=1 Tax=Salminus brasiliensis TaxID=930266 RepID=UPI003B838BBE
MNKLIKDKEELIQQLERKTGKQSCYPTAWKVDEICCAKDWKYFMGKCYYFSTDGKTWTASRDACVAVGGDLVIINTPEEEDFIKRSTSPSHLNYYWVGLTDAVKEGDWRWLDGTELSTTSIYWGEKQPDNWRGEKKNILKERIVV